MPSPSRLDVLACAALLLAALLACGGGATTSVDGGPSPTLSWEYDPDRICNKLEGDGVAADCKTGGQGALAKAVSFRLTGVYDYTGRVTQYVSDEEYRKFATLNTQFKTPPDDYPEFEIEVPKHRTIISWTRDVPSPTVWSVCRKTKKVAVCAKESPDFYNYFKALSTSAHKAAGLPAVP